MSDAIRAASKIKRRTLLGRVSGHLLMSVAGMRYWTWQEFKNLGEITKIRGYF